MIFFGFRLLQESIHLDCLNVPANKSNWYIITEGATYSTIVNPDGGQTSDGFSIKLTVICDSKWTSFTADSLLQ